ncbi:MaoC family dehydratase [Microbacterium terrisoli]|jgi:acyl dehydratase|uniref:MaoC family dehydratase n=1 Tax=Microbacterium terrisoli TaxID=3242192 RepID=UPI002805B9B3|nr:MaoC/PaaZ C-terminal domain-containing protein [Microbacterium protaetiae]
MQTLDRWFEDYAVGEERTTTGRTVTEADIVAHAGQTGDFFPHHMDAHWCATQPFGSRIAHGTLIMSMAVGMTAGEINPQSMSYGYDRVRFIRPVHIGDTITVTARITDKSDHRSRPDELGYVHEQVTVRNHLGETVLALVHLYLVNKKSRPATA